MADLTDLIERAWDTLSRWAVPVMMTLAYGFFATVADTSTVGKLWMAAGLGLVLIVWFAFRALTETAALSRALIVGDTAQLFDLADRHLPRHRRPGRRARFLIGRGLAHLLRGEHAAALAALEQAQPAPELQPLATTLRIIALIELGRGSELTAPGQGGEPIAPGQGSGLIAPGRSSSLAVQAPRTPWLSWLASGLLAWRANRLDEAAALFARVIDDIRTGSALRAIAHVYAARAASARGDAAAAARHQAAAADLAAPDAVWLRGNSVASPP